MPDVHFGIGATVGSVIPTLKRDHPGRGRRRHRLRHDRRARPRSTAERPARQPRRRCARRSSARCRTAGRRGARDPGAWSKTPRVGRHGLGAARAGVRARSAATTRSWRRPTTSSTSARSAAATTSSRCASTRRARLGHAALGLARRRQRDRHASSSSWRKQDMRCAHRQPARPRPRLLRGGRALLRRLRARRRLGAGVRAREPRGDDEAGDRGREDGDRQAVPEPRRGGELPPQLRAARAPLRRGRVVTRKGAVSAQQGELGIIPGSMGARSYIVRGKGNPESFAVVLRTAPAAR